MDFKGMITQMGEIVAGTSQRGDWRKVEFVITDPVGEQSLCCVAWGDLAENLHKQYKAAMNDVVPGNAWSVRIFFKVRSYTDKDGKQRLAQEIICTDFRNISGLANA